MAGVEVAVWFVLFYFINKIKRIITAPRSGSTALHRHPTHQGSSFLHGDQGERQERGRESWSTTTERNPTGQVPTERKAYEMSTSHRSYSGALSGWG